MATRKKTGAVNSAHALRDSLLASPARTCTVATPEWAARGCAKVLLHEWSLAEKKAWADAVRAQDSDEMAVVLMVVYSARDPGDGELIFKPEDAEAVRHLGASAIERIGGAVSTLNGMRGEDVEAAAKNS